MFQNFRYFRCCCFLWNIPSKVSYFFFPDKVHGPFIQSNRKIVFFFFREAGKKKNTRVYFFFPEKVHEAFIQDLVGFSFFFLKLGCVFFSTFLCVFFVFFFSCKSSHAIHSFDLEAVFFFSSLEKKIQLFHSFNRFCLKM